MSIRSVAGSWIFLVVLSFCAPVEAAETESKKNEWEGVQNMMNSGDFKAAGLEKLTPEELSRLNQWFFQFLAHDAQQVVNTDAKIKELQKAGVRSRIIGSFEGWDGDTVFKLENGEIWKQRHDGRYSIKLKDPEVEIYKNFLGFYEMRIVQTGRKIAVSRVK